MSKKYYCKCCFIETTGVEAFCEDCLDDGVSLIGGKNVDVKTGKPIDDEEWFDVPSPYKDYREKVL